MKKSFKLIFFLSFVILLTSLLCFNSFAESTITPEFQSIYFNLDTDDYHETIEDYILWSYYGDYETAYYYLCSSYNSSKTIFYNWALKVVWYDGSISSCTFGRFAQSVNSIPTINTFLWDIDDSRYRNNWLDVSSINIHRQNFQFQLPDGYNSFPFYRYTAVNPSLPDGYFSISNLAFCDLGLTPFLSQQSPTTIYNNGYSAGQTAGYSSGYSAGQTVGYTTGYSAGVSAGDTAGYNRGYAAGTAMGGYADGFTDGANGALTYNTEQINNLVNELSDNLETSSGTSWFESFTRGMWYGVTNLFNSIVDGVYFNNFTLRTLITSLFALLLVFFVIKLIAKG